MESYVLNVHGRQQGCLLQGKTFVPANGLVLSINNDPLQPGNNRNIGFVRSSLDKTGFRLLAADYHGSVYLFDLKKNRFRCVSHLGHCCSFLTFIPIRGKDIAVALSDCSVCFLDSETRSVKMTLRNHKSCVGHISVDEDGNRVITSSLEQAIIWDLHTFQLLHNLTIKKDVDILKVFFLPVKNYIVSAFKDGSVFMWDSSSLKCINNFDCDSEGSLYLRNIDCSSDGTLLACSGKVSWILVWNVETCKVLYKMSLSSHLTQVRELTFLSSSLISPDQHFVSVLSQDGKLHLYNIDAAEHLLSLSHDDSKIVSLSTAALSFKIAVICSSGTLKLYDFSAVLYPRTEENMECKKRTDAVPTVEAHEKKLIDVSYRKSKKDVPEVSIRRLKAILADFGEYPSKYRHIIWSQLLKLPKNEEYIVLYKDSSDVLALPLCADYPIASPILQRAFLRMMAMLIQWCPVMKEVDYLPFLMFPFVKMLHKNMQLCFELLVTLISNWCQNWFFHLPFPPFNILCAVENLLLFHDRALLLYFMQRDISSEIYAWSLLKTAFSEVFAKDEWLKLWDNIFSNPPEFLFYVVAAFNIVSRQVLLHCWAMKDFKAFFQRRGVLASCVIKKAHHLQLATPKCFDPGLIVGSFFPLPKGGYPVFNRVPNIEIDLQTLQRQQIVNGEVEYLERRASELELETIFNDICAYINEGQEKSDTENQRWNDNMAELKTLQEMRRNLILQSPKSEDIKHLNEVEEKLKRIQNLIQQNLIHQVEVFDCKLPNNTLTLPKEKQKQHLSFKDKVHKQAREKKTNQNMAYQQTVKKILTLRQELVEEDKK